MPPRLSPSPRSLRVHFDETHHADFHWAWLRAECSLERHPTTGERTLCFSQVPFDVSARTVELHGDEVVVRWAGEPPSRAPSRYPIAWLEEHRYAPDRVERSLPEPSTARWDTKLVGDAQLLPDDFLERLEREGAVLARSTSGKNDPDHTERLADQLAARGYSITTTHFGRIEDLRTDNTTNANTDQLGYTDAAIDLHTDQPFLEHPPRYQMLHAMRGADVGGASLLSDARAVAAWLEANDAEAHRTLTTTPVRFHRKQRQFERVLSSPILSKASVSEALQLRLSYFTLAPLRLPFAELEGFHRAYTRFVTLLRERAARFTLGPGDVLLYDNHRMAHGRTGFSGAPWVRGVYFDPAPTPDVRGVI